MKLACDPNLFGSFLSRVRKIIQYNYLEAFFKERKLELLSIPTQTHRQHLPKLEFSALGADHLAVPGHSNYMNPAKNFNIFEKMLTKAEDAGSEAGKKGVLSRSMVQP